VLLLLVVVLEVDFWCGWWRANISDAGFSFDTATNRGGWGMEWDLQVLDMRVRTLVRFVRRVVRRVGFMGMGVGGIVVEDSDMVCWYLFGFGVMVVRCVGRYVCMYGGCGGLGVGPSSGRLIAVQTLAQSARCILRSVPPPSLIQFDFYVIALLLGY